MSKHNIVNIASTKNGCVVTFNTDKGPRSYQYGRVAAKKIREDSRDPKDFRATEIKPN